MTYKVTVEGSDGLSIEATGEALYVEQPREPRSMSDVPWYLDTLIITLKRVTDISVQHLYLTEKEGA